jgi:hypothetical protein
MPDITSVVRNLSSTNSSDRYEACELLRVSADLAPEAIAALQVALQDPDPSVAEAASRALGAHLPPIAKPSSDAQPPAPASPDSSPRKSSSAGCILGILVAMLVGVVLLCRACSAAGSGSSSSGGDGSSSTSPQWSCAEFDAPFKIVAIDGEADVYSGVDQPNPTSVKGHITGGAAGFEASCSKAGEGSFYRLRGVDWWGGVRTDRTK